MKQNVIDDYNLLSGQQKAAVLMLSLDEEKSSALFSKMDDEEIKEFFNKKFSQLYLSKSKSIIENVNEDKTKNKILCKVSPDYFEEKEEVLNNYIIFYNSTNNSPDTSPAKNMVSHISNKSFGKANIEMQDFVQESANYSFQFGNNRNYKNSFNSSYSLNSDKLSEKEQIDFEKNYIDEINYLLYEIDLDDIFFKINPYILSSNFKDCNDGRTRNLKILEGEILKNAKLGSKEEAIKNSNALCFQR